MKEFSSYGFIFVDLKITNIFIIDKNFNQIKFGNFVAA